jgi:hypothetical protein
MNVECIRNDLETWHTEYVFLEINLETNITIANACKERILVDAQSCRFYVPHFAY